MRRLVLLFTLLVLCTACVPVGVAVADPYPVTNTKDSGPGSLRAAILAANGRAGEDTIPIAATGTINLETPLQVIFDNVLIVGPGADSLTVSRTSGAGFRIFGFSSDASLLSGLTISNGRSELGAGITNSVGSLTLDRVVVRDNEAVAEGDTKAQVEGGGIYSEGPLTLRETVIADNVARASDGSAETWALGGGVAALGALTVEASTISGNVAEASGDGTLAVAQGGGLIAGEDVVIERSTISGNTVDAGGAASQIRAQGGGVQAFEAILDSTTISGNAAISADEAFSANLHGGGPTPGSVLARNTIVANPLGADSCDIGGVNTIASGGFNLDEDGSCEFGEGSDLAGVDPLLGPLAANGGPTPTHALLTGSVAIDRGNSFGADIDQRGLPRPVDFETISNKEGGNGSDIGAFELQPPLGPVLSPILVTTVPGDRTPPNTRIVSGPPRSTFKRLAKFRFAATEAQSRFQCKVDKSRWRSCRNPFKPKVSAGKNRGRKHLFKVRAIDRFGNVDKSPARFSWRVKKIGG